jgi:hypothetical protein
MYICINKYKCICIYIYINIHMYIYIYIYIYVFILMYAYIYLNTYIYLYICTHAHIYMYVHIYSPKIQNQKALRIESKLGLALSSLHCCREWEGGSKRLSKNPVSPLHQIRRMLVVVMLDSRSEGQWEQHELDYRCSTAPPPRT